jgi:hypothetical protein
VLVQPIDAKRERHPAHRAEQIDRNRPRTARAVGQHRVLEQQRRPATGLFHHAIGNLAQLEIDPHRRRNAAQFSNAVDRRDEFTE